MGKNHGCSKKSLKEKVVQIYEAFFRGEDPSCGNPNFWDELFLLRVNVDFIEGEFERMNSEELIRLKDPVNSLFYHSVCALKADHQIRIVNALQTLCALARGVYKKTHGDFGFDVINLLVGFDVAESQMQVLIEYLTKFLTGGYPACLKSLVLKFLLILVTATENVSQNTLLEYLMMNSVFEAIIQLLTDPQTRLVHGYDAILLLTILVNYRKYETANPYIVKLSIVDNEVALNGYGQVVSVALSEFNRKFAQEEEEPQGGFLTTLTSMVGNMFVAEENGMETKSLRANDAVLLALYEAVHLNRNFITALTHSLTDFCGPSTSPTPVSSERTNQGPTDITDIHTPPSNLLVTFLEFSSIVFQNTKTEANIQTAKLCFTILICIAEDQYANSIMHDINMVFKVQLHRVPMRHRKVSSERRSPSRPLACAILDLMVEFIFSHMRKTLLLELFNRCLGIIHRLLCYQKKCRVRLQHNWKELWTALINLLKFMLSHESDLVKKYNTFQLAHQVINIFNLFITFGDTFLPSPTSYDELYYEIIRMHQVFDNTYSMALRYTTTGGNWKDSAAKLTNSLVNIRAIINHFSPKIDSWAATNYISTLTEEQVLDVVRNNYDTLTLKLHDNLDQFERYSEKPKESSFFTQMVRSVVSEYQQSLNFTSLEQQNLLQEFSTIT
ncbi:armadillo-like helical domain-containing protein 3 isoform X2 [Tachypleus tridentatus]|uniref:armadillo-like helical domain-containing protein 3 isoform X2 n=1 Tax=Tachypleus tridentatus TaxID=6853 RepID=UPI003FD43D2C